MDLTTRTVVLIELGAASGNMPNLLDIFVPDSKGIMMGAFGENILWYCLDSGSELES